MTVPWHVRDPLLLNRLRGELESKYPDLRVVVDDGVVWLEGSFPLVHEGIELDRFQVKILIPPDFPENIPVVSETTGRIPLDPVWHIYDTGTLCVIVPEEWLLNSESGSILAFLDGPLRNYFLGHVLAEAGLGRPMGERLHGSAGLLQAYGEWVGSNERTVIENYLVYLSKEKIPRQWFCPCGSGQKLRRCHGEHVRNLQKKIPPRIARMALGRLRFQLEREQSMQGRTDSFLKMP
jgi:hypothetical protein